MIECCIHVVVIQCQKTDHFCTGSQEYNTRSPADHLKHERLKKNIYVYFFFYKSRRCKTVKKVISYNTHYTIHVIHVFR